MNYLLVVAHPDDEVLGAGASLHKLIQQGHNVALCIMVGKAGARANLPETLSEDEAKALAAKLDTILVKIPASSGADGRLYGSITSKDIAEKLEKDYGITVDKRKIQLSDPIRAYGKYDLDVKLYTDVLGKVNVLICD